MFLKQLLRLFDTNNARQFNYLNLTFKMASTKPKDRKDRKSPTSHEVGVPRSAWKALGPLKRARDKGIAAHVPLLRSSLEKSEE